MRRRAGLDGCPQGPGSCSVVVDSAYFILDGDPCRNSRRITLAWYQESMRAPRSAGHQMGAATLMSIVEEPLGCSHARYLCGRPCVLPRFLNMPTNQV